MITLIAAVARNNVIGNNGKIPWNIPEEMHHFVRATMYGTVVMGRKTYEEIQVPLRKRINIVISSQDIQAEGFIFKKTLEEVDPKSYYNIIGGAQLYKYALDHDIPDRLLISDIREAYIGDTFFPAFDSLKYTKRLVFEHRRFTVYEYIRNR